jgi:anti-anti-sigma factor
VGLVDGLTFDKTRAMLAAYLHITIKQVGASLWLVQLDGEHDVSTTTDLRRTIQEIFETGSCVVVDVSGAVFMDSSVLGELIRASDHVKASANEKLVVVARSGSKAACLFELAGVDDAWFRRFESNTDAIDWCKGARDGPAIARVLERSVGARTSFDPSSDG